MTIVGLVNVKDVELLVAGRSEAIRWIIVRKFHRLTLGPGKIANSFTSSVDRMYGFPRNNPNLARPPIFDTLPGPGGDRRVTNAPWVPLIPFHQVLPYGLTIHRFFVQVDGRVRRESPPSIVSLLILTEAFFQTHDLVIGPESPHMHKHIKYTNTVVGRYANRLPVKEHLISPSRAPEIQASFTPLPNETPDVSLHGGQVGFDEKFWEPIPIPPSAGEVELFSDTELRTIESEVATATIFKYISEDGEQGYPGRLRVEALIGLLQPEASRSSGLGEFNLGSVLIVYRAKLLEEGKVTPINLTQVRPTLLNVPSRLSWCSTRATTWMPQLIRRQYRFMTINLQSKEQKPWRCIRICFQLAGSCHTTRVHHTTS